MRKLYFFVGLLLFFSACMPAGLRVSLNELGEVQAGQEVALRFSIEEGERVLKAFEVEHEKLLHLIVVRKDLSEFMHVHPELDTETGEFSVPVTFPEAGPYRVFADFVPEGGSKTVLTFDVNVPGKYQVAELVPSSENVSTVGPFEVNSHFPTEIHVGDMVNYDFDVTRDGEPVTLEPYLGALGHSVIVRADSLDYLHVHPEHEGLAFMTTFSKTGLYKVFTQFQVEGEVYTVERVAMVE